MVNRGLESQSSDENLGRIGTRAKILEGLLPHSNVLDLALARTAHLHLVPRLGMSGAKPPYSHMPYWRAYGEFYVYRRYGQHKNCILMQCVESVTDRFL